MLSLDTNILLRYTLGDHATLSPKAKDIIEGQTCHIPLLVLAEFGFVLTSYYESPTTDLVRTVRALMQIKNLRFDREGHLLQALRGVEAGMDWFDAMLWVSIPDKNELGSFDKKFVNRAAKQGWKPKVVSLL
jgi:predicted nucleic-acid-binding protein